MKGWLLDGEYHQAFMWRSVFFRWITIMDTNVGAYILQIKILNGWKPICITTDNSQFDWSNWSSVNFSSRRACLRSFSESRFLQLSVQSGTRTSEAVPPHVPQLFLFFRSVASWESIPPFAFFSLNKFFLGVKVTFVLLFSCH